MLLRLGQVPTVVASSAAAAEEALKTRDLSFSGRPRLLMADRLYYGTRDMVFAPYGERWRQLRRVCVAHLLSPRRVLGFRAAREREVAALLDGVRAAAADGAAAVLNLSDLLIAYSNAVISRATFGDARGHGLDGGGAAKLRKVFGEFEELLGTVPMAEMVPWLWPVDVLTGLDRKARRTAEEIDRLIERVVADKSPAAAFEAGEEIDGVRLDTVTIKATILDMLVAGTDTTYTLLEWAMAELVNHPTQMRKLQDEVRTAAGGIVTEDDLPRLPYLKAVIKETLRLHPPGPLLLPRETLEDAGRHQCLGDRPGPGDLGARRGVRAGEVRCHGRRRRGGGVPQDGGGLQVLAVRGREEGVSRRRVRRAICGAGARELAVPFRLGGSWWRQEAIGGGHERGERTLRAPQDGSASRC
ncbi:unnamed protein product [Urochloa decumbens]|uniref:Uncharacterized protein n=1 Tax=Urochloa decumbens TaxID=240449 RepID=A0ABC8ZR93_9POAL